MQILNCICHAFMHSEIVSELPSFKTMATIVATMAFTRLFFEGEQTDFRPFSLSVQKFITPGNLKNEDLLAHHSEGIQQREVCAYLREIDTAELQKIGQEQNEYRKLRIQTVICISGIFISPPMAIHSLLKCVSARNYAMFGCLVSKFWKGPLGWMYTALWIILGLLSAAFASAKINEKRCYSAHVDKNRIERIAGKVKCLSEHISHLRKIHILWGNCSREIAQLKLAKNHFQKILTQHS